MHLKTVADVFEKVINTCLEYYGLDPCHYFSSSRLSWYAILKMAGVELKLISDIDMHFFIENEITPSKVFLIFIKKLVK